MDRLDLAGQPLHELANPEPLWRRASCCASNECVEAARQTDVVLVRDGIEAQRRMLRCAAEEWRSFVQAIKTGLFDA
jgi:hypothetical protein